MGELTVLDVTSSLCNKDTVVCVIAPDVVVVGPYYCKDVAVFNFYLVSSFTWHHGNRPGPQKGRSSTPISSMQEEAGGTGSTDSSSSRKRP